MLLTVEEIARDSQISKFTWWLWIRQGKLPTIRLGRRIRVEEEVYKRFLEAHRAGYAEGGDTQKQQERRR